MIVRVHHPPPATITVRLGTRKVPSATPQRVKSPEGKSDNRVLTAERLGYRRSERIHCHLSFVFTPIFAAWPTAFRALDLPVRSRCTPPAHSSGLQPRATRDDS
jgi:hypothetical protein